MVRRLAAAAAALLVLAVGPALWAASRPMPSGPPVRVTVAKRTGIEQVLERLQRLGVVRNAFLAGWGMRAAGGPRLVAPGTYEVRPGMAARELGQALRKPVPSLVTVPEGLWIARTAERLTAQGLDGAGYRLAAKETLAGAKLGVPPDAPSLEGYLFPDTYDWPPGTSGRAMVARQLEAFRTKALPAIGPVANLHEVVIVASLVELEAKRPEERARIAGVVRNRLAKGMRLEIDATVLYGIQEWRELRPGEVRRLASRYNTYLHPGLPPGPVCSPGLASLRAAARPEAHPWLYYVAKPDGSHLFARTYDEHRQNIRKARAAAP